MVELIRKHALAVFFILAYAFTWLRWLPEAAAGRGWIDYQTPSVLVLLAGYGPALAAVLVTALVSGRSGLKDLGARLVRWRVALVWYLVVIALPVITQLAGCALYIMFSGAVVELDMIQPDWSLILMYLPIFILGFDGLGEELGWRGFALPKMLKNQSAVLASLVLGLLWGFWHLGYWLTPGSFMANTPLTLVITNTIALSFIHTWIFTHVRQSVLLAILFHAINNTTSIFLANTLPFYAQPQVGWTINLVNWFLVLWLLLLAKPYRLIDRIAGRNPPQDAGVIP
jgi:membrane protease YdiL (CAAX protease family)